MPCGIATLLLRALSFETPGAEKLGNLEPDAIPGSFELDPGKEFVHEVLNV